MAFNNEYPNMFGKFGSSIQHHKEMNAFDPLIAPGLSNFD